MIKEGNAIIEECAFYNPFMKLSRDIGVEIIKRIEDELHVLDAFAATGIRGIRYFLEGKVKSVSFLDLSEKACECIKRNLKLNKMVGAVIKDDFNRHFSFSYNFIEIDPFGSPAAFINHAVFLLKNWKRAYLSITATDTAVLCGKHKHACIRNYGSKPLRDRSCHETGLRILLKHIAFNAFLFDFSIKPLISFYYRHQMKCIVMLIKGAKAIHEQLKDIGYIYKCNKCLQKWYSDVFKISGSCPECDSKSFNYAGPLWIGKMHDKELIKDIKIPLVKKILEENDEIPFNYDLHEIAKHYHISEIPKIRSIVKALNATRCHSNPKGIKHFSVKDVVNTMKVSD